MSRFGLRRRLRARAETAVRRLWMRYALRGVGQRDAHDKLDLAYVVPDPWKLDSAPEHARFRGTSEHLTRAFGRPGTILEVGCGEGIQSEYFARQCDRLTGIDVSPRAIERAKLRLPDAELAAGDLYAMPWATAVDRFDVVVACEVIYYMSDVPRFLAAMSRLGRGCLVTYFAAAERKMGPLVRAVPGVALDEIRYDGPGEPGRWVVATWTPGPDAKE